MKKFFSILVIMSFILSGSLVFAGSQTQTPGDGGFFTKFFNGILGDSWKKSPETVKQEKEARKKAKASSKKSK